MKFSDQGQGQENIDPFSHLPKYKNQVFNTRTNSNCALNTIFKYPYNITECLLKNAYFLKHNSVFQPLKQNKVS